MAVHRHSLTSYLNEKTPLLREHKVWLLPVRRGRPTSRTEAQPFPRPCISRSSERTPAPRRILRLKAFGSISSRAVMLTEMCDVNRDLERCEGARRPLSYSEQEPLRRLLVI